MLHYSYCDNNETYGCMCVLAVCVCVTLAIFFSSEVETNFCQHSNEPVAICYISCHGLEEHLSSCFVPHVDCLNSCSQFNYVRLSCCK